MSCLQGGPLIRRCITSFFCVSNLLSSHFLRLILRCVFYPVDSMYVCCSLCSSMLIARHSSHQHDCRIHISKADADRRLLPRQPRLDIPTCASWNRSQEILFMASVLAGTVCAFNTHCTECLLYNFWKTWNRRRRRWREGHSKISPWVCQ